MTAALATPGTGAANPGSFYGRGGPSPRNVLDAAVATERATTALRDTIKRTGDYVPLSACLDPAAHLRRTARTLTSCLTIEAGITARALTADLALPEPAAATQARRHLQQAARHTGAAGSETFTAWRALRALTAGDDSERTDGGPIGKAAAGAADAAAELQTQLRNANRQLIPAALPMIAGHRTITNYLALALIDLRTVCGELAFVIRHTPRAARGENRVTGPLHHASDACQQACNAAMRAHDTLSDAADIIHKAPPGYPCATCGGTSTSRLTSGLCTACRGGGIDVRAMRPVTDY